MQGEGVLRRAPPTRKIGADGCGVYKGSACLVDGKGDFWSHVLPWSLSSEPGWGCPAPPVASPNNLRCPLHTYAERAPKTQAARGHGCRRSRAPASGNGCHIAKARGQVREPGSAGLMVTAGPPPC